MTRESRALQALGEKFQYRKRYEVTCDNSEETVVFVPLGRFNTASGMRSHVTHVLMCIIKGNILSFNTASGMRSHVT